MLTLYGNIDSESTMFLHQKAKDWLKKPLFHEVKGRKMIPTNFELAGDFMEAFGQEVQVQPT